MKKFRANIFHYFFFPYGEFTREWLKWEEHAKTNTSVNMEEIGHCDACHLIHKFRNICKKCNRPVCILCIHDFDGEFCVFCRKQTKLQEDVGCPEKFEFCKRMMHWLYEDGTGRHCDVCHEIEYEGVNAECPNCQSWQCGICDYKNGCKCGNVK
jgi:hypothetical protein